MAASTSSSPAWRGMCRWRQTLGSSRTLATSSGVTCTGRMLDRRSRSSPSMAVRRSTSRARASRSPRSSPYLPRWTPVSTTSRTPRPTWRRTSSTICSFGVGAQRAAGPGDDAEGAPLVAAGLGLDGHPGAEPLDRGRPHHQRQPAHLGNGRDQLGQPVLAVVVDHQVDPGDGPDGLGVGDRVAAGDDHGGLGVGLGRLADQAARGGGRLPGHGAGVDHHHVGGLAGVGQVEPARPQRLQGLLALGLVEPAAEGLERDLGRLTPPQPLPNASTSEASGGSPGRGAGWTRMNWERANTARQLSWWPSSWYQGSSAWVRCRHRAR